MTLFASLNAGGTSFVASTREVDPPCGGGMFHLAFLNQHISKVSMEKPRNDLATSLGKSDLRITLVLGPLFGMISMHVPPPYRPF